MGSLVFALVLAVVPGAAVFAANAGLPPCPPGWDAKKWADPRHQTPKYAIGRILAIFPHTPEGLRMAMPVIQKGYPGASILPGKGDKAHIPCVGVIDLIQAAGEGGKAWQWLVVKDECGSCKPNVCELGKSPGSAAGSEPGAGQKSPSGPTAGNCMPPNEKATVDRVLARPGMAEALRRACRNNTDWTFPNAVVDELRKSDLRWGFFCRRGNCNDPSHDVIAYYCGPGKPFEGADAARGVDYIAASCYNSPSDGTPSIAWTILDPNPSGVKAWTSRGRFSTGAGPSAQTAVEMPELPAPETIPAAETTSPARSRAAPRAVHGAAPRREEAPEASPAAAQPEGESVEEPPAEEEVPAE